MAMRKPIVLDTANRSSEIDSSDELLVPGGVRTSASETGGGSLQGRHVWTTPAGGYHMYDAGSDGVFERYRFAPDGQPAGVLTAQVYAESGANTLVYSIATATGRVTLHQPAALSAGAQFDGPATHNAALVNGNILRPTISTSTTNNWSPTGLVVSSATAANTILANPTLNATVTGLSAAQVDGAVVYLHNDGSGSLTLAGESTSSAAANRFSQTLALQPGEGVVLMYDGAAQRWLAIHVPDGADVQIFASSGTWTKPTRAQTVVPYLLAGGGGGGAGCKGTTGTLRRGGHGGGGGATTQLTLAAAALPATVAVTVGTGGAGAPGGNAAAGASGSDGGNTTFGSYALAQGGPGGPGGTASGIDATPTPAAGLTSDGAPPNASSTTGAAGAIGANARYAGAAGGCGGGITTANATSSGSRGGPMAALINSANQGGAGGGAGAAGTNGSSPLTNLPGTGGGGGGSSLTGSGQGGTGGRASGGGGSGATQSGTVAAGGAGGDGLAVIVTYR